VGNSKALILPADLIKKYDLEKVIIEETEDGILIRSANRQTGFQKTLEKLRKNKSALYKRIRSQAENAETLKYYSQRTVNFSDVDTDIVEE
jgi:antitoxin component of MazEF toxin-antitoxin module